MPVCPLFAVGLGGKCGTVEQRLQGGRDRDRLPAAAAPAGRAIDSEDRLFGQRPPSANKRPFPLSQLLTPIATSTGILHNSGEARFRPYQSARLRRTILPCRVRANMRRREFLRVLGSGAAVWPVIARAQQTRRMRCIGVLAGLAENDPEGQRRLTALLQGLRELGWIEGQNLRIEYRWGTNDLARMRTIAQELVAIHPDLLLALSSSPAVVAFQKETSTIPILFVNTTDPIGGGITPSLSRPSSNVTGFTNFEYSISGKWMDLLKKCAPHVARASLLFNPDTAPYGLSYVLSFEAAAALLIVEPHTMSVRDVAEMERAIAVLGTGNGLIVVNDTFNLSNRKVIMALAAQYQLPAIYPLHFFATEGGLMSYGPDVVEIHRRSASYIDRILKGESAGNLPIQQPTKYELVINTKTARMLGLDVPPTLLASADQVIE
jgi:putative tryptophan/tyrosine transport system substrate-binding protein